VVCDVVFEGYVWMGCLEVEEVFWFDFGEV